MAVLSATPSTDETCAAADVRLPERLYPLSTLAELGYGSRATLKERIKRGEIPAVRVGNVIKIRDRDLALLAQPIVPATLQGGEAA